ncbi:MULTISPECIES: CaiB/BaiF CoA-transferase family protein [unclassified Beijerinckia]|uniref:CaiB/BaiF CoA transferase family protein n=1 Tax=unclassified Beijerinckia TaxID=2638183 RepID=UPI0008944402|nr:MULTISPECIES: CaiB/BaiF CoA-transferase family protein [unclassified Beijerinckia]MDH7799261.1 CoA:oxalate CoA-transferase [Beijerinckia sp. GAS462]SED90404.1 Crotonobetainyl-CoA:carnitine CoA-transferase CaiB [Beijerinckia sp. 28-YEA-48]
MNTEATSGYGPLSHLKVLDLTQFLSGPYATQLLGDMGADVVKIEAPDGDMTRRLPPHFVGTQSAYYLSVNRNKKSLTVDMKTAAGLALVRKLAQVSDVVVENFRPGILEKLGISYEDIKAVRPGLVWCSISGFGQAGPYKNRPAYDMIVQAMSGGMSITGPTEGPSVRSGIPLGDIAAGMYGVIGILAALADRDRSGKGKHVDISMLDCQVAMLSYQAAYYLNSGNVPERQGRGHDSIPTYRTFTCGDAADIVVTANTERMWSSLCDVLSCAELSTDSRFADNKRRYINREALWRILEDAFLTKSAQEWVDLMLAAEVPAAVVNTLDRSLTDPQVIHRNMVLELAGPNGEKLRVAGNPIKFANEDEVNHRYPPLLGGDSLSVLSDWLGMNAGDVNELRCDSAFGPNGR